MDRTVENVIALVNNGYSTRQLAEVFGVAQTTIRSWMKVRGIKANNSWLNDTKKSWTDQQLINAVLASKTKSNVLRILSLSVRPGNFETINKAIKRLNLDISHFSGKAHGTSGRKVFTNEEVFIENSQYNRKGIKERILKDSLIKYECCICGIKEWNNIGLILVLDHINGISDDHRIENLRFLCPNCNSQQDTFCRKSKGGI